MPGVSCRRMKRSTSGATDQFAGLPSGQAWKCGRSAISSSTMSIIWRGPVASTRAQVGAGSADCVHDGAHPLPEAPGPRALDALQFLPHVPEFLMELSIALLELGHLAL